MKDQTLARSERYLTVDSLRGIAALAVAVYHIHQPAFKDIHSVTISILSSIFQFGYLGVPIFFVISGFVIAATIKPSDVTFGYIGKFIVKRATRLDPPYWLSIALDIFLMVLTIHLFHIGTMLPSTPQVISHLFYLQNLLGYGDIAANYYTLCFEVQFYIFFGLVFAIWGKFRAYSFTQPYSNLFLVVMFSTTTIYSLLITGRLVENPLDGLFISHWYLFVLGAICYWASVTKNISKLLFFSFCLLSIGLFILDAENRLHHSLNTLVAVITALLLYVAAIRKKMTSWLSNKTLLYLGSISYSLYLFHGIVGDRAVAFVREWLLPKLSITMDTGAMAIALLCFALGLAILTSHFAYTFIEKPSLKISKKIKPNKKTSIFSDIRNTQKPMETVPNIPESAAIIPYNSATKI